MTTTIKPILKYPGAKWNLAEWIISHFPAHKHYVEPYFGSGAVFFNKQPAAHEVINDLSGDVVNLFRVIRERGEELAALIEMTPYSRQEYYESRETVDDPLERARRFICLIWQSHASSGLLNKKGGWWHMVTGDRYVTPVSTWLHIPNTLRGAIQRLRSVEIECKPAIDIIKSFNSGDCLVYADPPYPLSTRAGKMYQHEMTDADHAQLLDTLDAHPGPVVLSGYHCALYDDRLKHWHVREKQAQAEKGDTRTEVLWLNQTCVDRLGYGPMFDGVTP